jgi:hypothetical protein
MSAIQAATYMFGLLLAILMSFLLQSTTLLCRAIKLDQESDYMFPDQPEFCTPVYGGIFNCMEYVFSLGRVRVARVEQGMHQVSRLQ